MDVESNKRIVARRWRCLYAKDFDGVAACIAPDGHYEDVPAPAAALGAAEAEVFPLRYGVDLGGPGAAAVEGELDPRPASTEGR